ncbi:MAG: YlxR family protein [Clostridia bacterium]|nr:YlxR family protein [Clostridia bacterium]
MKYIPQRKCIACQSIRPKKEMLRMAKLSDGTYQLDKTHKSSGRGAYLCNNDSCIQTAIKKSAFHRSFKTKVPAECYEQLERLKKDV